MTTGPELRDIWLNMVKAVLGAAPQMCLTCGHYKGGKCLRFDQPVPSDYAEEKNGCGSWKTMDVSMCYTDLENIPF